MLMHYIPEVKGIEEVQSEDAESESSASHQLTHPTQL
jgi:hypothetical protein